jgi:hypothetical protein
MSKIFKRPMFRKGGEVGGGITSGLRSNFEVGGSARERLMKVYEDYPVQSVDPLSQFLIQGGLNLMSATPRGGTLATAAEAFKEPTSQLFTGLGARDKARRDIAVSGEMLDIEGDIKKDIEKLKAREGTGFLKEETVQRAYEDEVSKRIASKAGLTSFQKPNVEQAYPRQTAEYDTYILRNLRVTDNPIGQEINANNLGIVPYDPKTGDFDFTDLVPGAYYFYPLNKVFVQSVPPSEGEEGGIYQINPYTFQRSKVE